MKTYQIFLISLFTFISLTILPAHSSASQFEQNYLKNLYGHSVDCVDKNLGITFYCNPNWKIISSKNKLSTTISTYPNVTFTVEKLNSKMDFLSQINRFSLESMNRYAEGFGTEHITIANRETLKIKAYSKKNQYVRLSDYYLINNLALYRISFSVNDKDDWDKYKFLIRDIMKSFNFTNSKK